MELPIKPPDRVVPEYSLTGDLLSYRRCAMQYRYYNGSAFAAVPPGPDVVRQFIHGVLEGAFGMWRGEPGAISLSLALHPNPGCRCAGATPRRSRRERSTRHRMADRAGAGLRRQAGREAAARASPPIAARRRLSICWGRTFSR